MADDHDYYRRRVEQEQARAANAERPEVRRAHLELAGLYADRLAGQRPALRIVG